MPETIKPTDTTSSGEVGPEEETIVGEIVDDEEQQDQEKAAAAAENWDWIESVGQREMLAAIALIESSREDWVFEGLRGLQADTSPFFTFIKSGISPTTYRKIKDLLKFLPINSAFSKEGQQLTVSLNIRKAIDRLQDLEASPNIPEDIRSRINHRINLLQEIIDRCLRLQVAINKFERQFWQKGILIEIPIFGEVFKAIVQTATSFKEERLICEKLHLSLLPLTENVFLRQEWQQQAVDEIRTLLASLTQRKLNKLLRSWERNYQIICFEFANSPPGTFCDVISNVEADVAGGFVGKTPDDLRTDLSRLRAAKKRARKQFSTALGTKFPELEKYEDVVQPHYDKSETLEIMLEEKVGKLSSAHSVKEPQAMTIHELYEELVTAFFETERRKEVNTEFLKKIGSVPEAVGARMRSDIALVARLYSEGDAEARQFGVIPGKICAELGKVEADPERLALAYFQEIGSTPIDLTTEDMFHLPIKQEAIDFWNLVVDIIRGSLAVHRRVDTGDHDFSYYKLIGNVVEDLKIFLKDHFRGQMSDKDIDALIVFCQNMDVRSVSYCALMVEYQTQIHAFTPASGDRSVPLPPHIKAVAWLAAGIYTRHRYELGEPHHTAEDYLFLSDRMMKFIFRGKDSDKHYDTANKLRELVKEYRILSWGSIPRWVTDIQDLMDTPDSYRKDHYLLDLREPTLPLQGQLIIRGVEMEKISQELLRLPVDRQHRSATLRRKKRFVDYGIARGWTIGQELDNFDGNNEMEKLDNCLKEIGVVALHKVNNWGKYQGVLEAVVKRSDFFQTKFTKKIDAEEARELMKKFKAEVIGQMKLIPGQHWYFLAPDIMRYMHVLTHNFEHRRNKFAVRGLVDELMEVLEGGSGGIPRMIVRQVRAYYDEEGYEAFVTKTHWWWKERAYTTRLWKFNSTKTDLLNRFLKTVPTAILVASSFVPILNYSTKLINDDGTKARPYMPWKLKSASQ